MLGMYWIVITLELVSLHVARGNEYDCMSTPQTAYTPDGTFYLPQGRVDKPSSCTLTIAKDLFRSSKAKLRITIRRYNRSYDATCNADYLQVANRYRYCNSIVNRSVEINDTSASIDISYHSEVSTNSSFLIHYVVYTDLCAQTDSIHATPLVIHQPPGSFNRECFLSIDTARAHLLLISALLVDSESVVCSFTDAVYVETDLASQLCQGEECVTPSGINITSLQTIRVRLQLGYHCGFFWKLTTQSLTAPMDICSQTGNELTLPEGTISSPGYLTGFPGPLNCTVTISPRFELVAVDLKYYSLEQRACQRRLNNNPCYCGDRLIINNTAICGKMSGAHKAYQIEKPLTIELLTLGDLGTNNGFYLSYQGYENATDICTKGQKLSFPLLVKSPIFPQNYPRGANCSMSAEVAGADKLVIKFLVFDIEADDSCIYDYFSINGQRFCGNRGGEDRELDLPPSASLLQLHFKSDKSGDHQGFYISIEKYIATHTTSTTLTTTKLASMDVTTEAKSTGSTAISKPELHSAVVMDEGLSLSTMYSDVAAILNESITSQAKSSTETEAPSLTSQEQFTQRTVGDSGIARRGCPLPWYYWIITIIGILSAVLITMTIFLIKLKRLKVEKYKPRYTAMESSRDGLANPVYFNNLNSHSNSNALLGNPYYTNKDRVPAGRRVYINKNSIQTTV